MVEEQSGTGSRGGDSGGYVGGDHLFFTSEAIVFKADDSISKIEIG